jgi:hypothetical protein
MSLETAEKAKARRAVRLICVVMMIFIFAPLLIYFLVQKNGS